MSRYLADYPRYTWQLLNGFRVKHEQRFAQLRLQDISPFLDTHQPLRILDLANGRLRPQYTLLKAAGHEVYGVDWVNHAPRSGVDQVYKAARWLFQWKLGISSVQDPATTLACSNVGALPFPAQSFDLVTSVAAFEHFLDVPQVVLEIHRVLRPGGVAWVCAHLFTSPSGGHNLSFTEIPLRRIPPAVAPWDHLRERRLPFHVPLNEWRKDQYLTTFAQNFEVIKHYCAMREGEQWLTPEVEAELADYSRDELTCAALIIVARKVL